MFGGLGIRIYEPAKTVLRALELIDPLRRCGRYLHVPRYIRYHEFVFSVTNTKFGISYCVFQESFIADQYNIRRFLDRVGESEEICFIDLGRNHGFVFYYMMYYIMKARIRISTINYYGIDPSPLKFVCAANPCFARLRAAVTIPSRRPVLHRWFVNRA